MINHFLIYSFFFW